MDEGSLLGGALAVRRGAGLREHVHRCASAGLQSRLSRPQTKKAAPEARP
jgi:hypothetical protein